MFNLMYTHSQIKYLIISKETGEAMECSDHTRLIACAIKDWGNQSEFIVMVKEYDGREFVRNLGDEEVKGIEGLKECLIKYAREVKYGIVWMGQRMERRWVDTTFYLSASKERIPRSYEINFDGISIRVYRFYGKGANSWYYTCKELGIEERSLNAKSIEGVKKEALNAIKNILPIRANKLLIARDTIKYFLL